MAGVRTALTPTNSTPPVTAPVVREGGRRGNTVNVVVEEAGVRSVLFGWIVGDTGGDDVGVEGGG